MILQLIVIALVLLIGYWWAGQGALSGLLHFLSVVGAGAVAFGVWELVTVQLLFKVDNELVQSIAWTVGLLVPFLIALIVLRVLCDKAVGANIQLQPAMNFVLGLVFGLGSGVLTVGILVIGIGFLQLKANFGGFQALEIDGSGNVSRQRSLWLPVDKLTEQFYGIMSQAAFATSHPLHKYQPNVADSSSLIRMSIDSGTGKNAMRPGDLEIASVLEVTAGNVNELYKYTPGDAPYAYEDPWNGRVTSGTSYIITVNFKSSARENSGTMAVGNAQYRLIAENDAGDVTTVVPMAVIAKAEARSDDLGRFRFDSKDMFIGSIAGTSTPTMAFEYLVPTGYAPKFFEARRLRIALPDGPWDSITAAERNRRIATGQMSQAAKPVPDQELDRSNAARLSGGGAELIKVNDRLPNRWMFQKADTSGLTITDDRRIQAGTFRFNIKDLRRDIPRDLAIDKFFQAPGTRVVQVRVDFQNNNPLALPSPNINESDPTQIPLLIDDRGAQFTAVGYIYADATLGEISLEPGSPIETIDQLPSLSRSRSDQELYLVFRVTGGSTIREVSYGADVVGLANVQVRR
jgi:hypothetical protein